MKKTLSTILVLIVSVFVFQNNCGAVLLDRIVATVNDEVITWSELMNVIVIDGKKILSGATGKEREKRIREIERPFLNSLIEMKLQLQEAQRIGLYVGNEEIDGAINEIMEKYGLTEEGLIDSLKAEGLTLEDYRRRLGDQILLQKVVNFAVRNNIVISDKEIEEYYNKNRDKFDAEERLRISQIFFAMPEDSAQKTEVEAKARDIVQQLRNGGDFAELARKYSEDASREFGGDLGYISRGSILKEVEEVAFSLKEGEVSDPFWSPVGLHIIKVVEKTETGGMEKVREKIKEILFQKAFEQRYRQWKAELREKAFIEIKL